MKGRRKRIARLSSTSSSGSQSLSHAPSESGPPIQSAAHRALVMGFIDADPRPDLVLSPTPPSWESRLLATEDSPSCRIRCVHTKPAFSQCFDVVERMEALDMSEEETQELMEEAPWHVRRWVQDLPEPAESLVKSPSPVPPTAEEITVIKTEVEVRPSTSGVTEPTDSLVKSPSPVPPTAEEITVIKTEVDVSPSTSISSPVPPTTEEITVIKTEVDVSPSTSPTDSLVKSPSPLPPTAEEITVTKTEVEDRPSTSGVTASSRAPRRVVADGSDFDSDFDDEFDVPEAMPGASKEIPDTVELDEPIQKIINDIDTGMDDAADRLLGTSPSFTWVSDFESFRGVREDFTGPTPGALKDYDSPYDAFIDIWDKDIIGLIALETNRYAQQTIETKRSRGTLKPCSRLHAWTATNPDEIMLLFAMYMYMAIDPRTILVEYWTKNEVLQLPGFKRLMSYNRYILLNKFLHFVDNTAVASQQLPQSGDPPLVKLSPKLGKLAPIIEHLGKKFKSLYNLGPNICIDESLTLFKGRLSWVQTIRSKAARFGIKSYELCEPNTGYMAGFQIYTGESDNSDGVNFGKTSTKVVLELLQGLEHQGYCVVMDNFYNCPALARYLKSLGFDCLGTLRATRRNVPSDIKVQQKLSKGTIISRHCGDVSIIAWMDSKMVNIISTYHRPDTYIGTRSGKSSVKPVCVRDYNTIMGGVDLKDQKLSLYLLERKRGVKWYGKMFKRLLNVSIHNALIMYLSSLKRRDKLPVTHREFRYKLAEALVKRHGCSVPETSRPVGDLMRLRRDILHEPVYKKGRQFRRRCVICYRKRENKMVHTKCAQCDVYLCFVNCWGIWHTAAELPNNDIRHRKRRRVE